MADDAPSSLARWHVDTYYRPDAGMIHDKVPNPHLPRVRWTTTVGHLNLHLPKVG
jgi:hypothetical protein